MTNEKGQRTNNDLQNTTQKTKDRATRIRIKTWGEPRCCGKVTSSCSTSHGGRSVNLVSR